MAVNRYFQGGNGIGNTSEKRLYEDLIIEGLQIYGHDCFYLPRTLVKSRYNIRRRYAVKI